MINDKHRVAGALPVGNAGAQTVVGRVMGPPQTQLQRGKSVFEIPIDSIKARPVNNYSITGIDELAESIKRTGLWQPIIVRKNPENPQKYIIVSGERRYTAFRKLHNEALREHNEADAKLFSTISSIILSGEDLEKEAAIYAETNDYSRQISNFERILRMDPSSIDLTHPETRQEYLDLCFGENIDPSSVVVRGSDAEKAKYIAALLNRKDPDLDISDSTVRTYMIFIERCTSSLLHAILKGIVSLRDARRAISYLTPQDQKDAVLAAGTDAYEEFIRKGEEIAADMKKVPEKPKVPEDLIVSASKISRKLYGARKDFEKIYNDTTYRRDLDENQKEYLVKMRQAMAAIEAVKEAEEKMLK